MAFCGCKKVDKTEAVIETPTPVITITSDREDYIKEYHEAVEEILEEPEEEFIYDDVNNGNNLWESNEIKDIRVSSGIFSTTF